MIEQQPLIIVRKDSDITFTGSRRAKENSRRPFWGHVQIVSACLPVGDTNQPLPLEISSVSSDTSSTATCAFASFHERRKFAERSGEDVLWGFARYRRRRGKERLFSRVPRTPALLATRNRVSSLSIGGRSIFGTRLTACCQIFPSPLIRPWISGGWTPPPSANNKVVRELLHPLKNRFTPSSRCRWIFTFV